MAPKAIEIFKKGQQIIEAFCCAPLFLGANKPYVCCLEGTKKNIHMFLESTNFAEECFPYGSLSTRHPCKSANILFWTTCNMCSLLESQIVKLKTDLKKNLRGPLLGKHFDRCIFLYTFSFVFPYNILNRHQNKKWVFDQTHVSKTDFILRGSL